MVTDTGTVAIPGTPASGDRMFLFGTWKTFDVTVADPDGWTPIGTVFADGTTNAGNGTGSVSVMAWYRDWVTGDADPAIDYSAAPTEGHWVIQLWTKAGGDTWDTPTTVTGAISAGDPFTVDASATTTIPDASVVMGLVGLRDDSTTFTRATDALDDTGALVTWNGDYVESPATHYNSTTGLDASGDLGHRFVTTGAAGVTLHMDGDISASESGAAKWVIQGLFTSDPKTATPSTLALTTATFAPTVRLGTIVTPSTLALTTATFAPTVTATQNQLLTPGVKALTLTTYVPLVIIVSHGQQINSGQGSVTPGQLYTPSTLSLSLSTFAPTVTATTGGAVTVTPGTLSLTTATFAPTVTTTGNVVVTPDVTALSLTAFAPEVTASGAPPVVVTPRVVIGRGRRSFVEIDGQTLEVSGFAEAERLLNRIKKAEQAQEQDRKRVTILLGKAKGPQNVGLYKAQEVEVIEKRIDDRAEKIAQLYAMILQNLDHDDDDEEMFFL
jgi:hypothetical protein